MLLHIGNGKTLRGEEIIGIFDLDNATIAKDSRTYLSRATKAGEVSYADSDIPRAFVVTAARSAPSARVILSVARPDPDAPHRPSGSTSFHSAQDDTFGVGARSRTAAGVPRNEQGEFRGFAAKRRRPTGKDKAGDS